MGLFIRAQSKGSKYLASVDAMIVFASEGTEMKTEIAG